MPITPLHSLPETISGAEFTADRQYRWALWRIWDRAQPMMMVIGLNPSTANETHDDPTIKSICRIAKANGFGGVFMMNCFSFISTDPARLTTLAGDRYHRENKKWLTAIAPLCSEVVFAWGNFSIVKAKKIERMLHATFPNAKCLAQNRNGSPKHPLYCRSDSPLIPYLNHEQPAS